MRWASTQLSAESSDDKEMAMAVFAGENGATISYQLPLDGPLPRTYCVTLAIVDAKNPDWIVSTFVAALPLFLGFLVWVPVAIASTYAAYRGIFTEKAAS